jgi:hypothetical protein
MKPPPETTKPIRSGLDLAGVLYVAAYVHGEWRPANVRYRNRRSVDLSYSLEPGPRGGASQRVSVDRVRVPIGEDEAARWEAAYYRSRGDERRAQRAETRPPLDTA